MEEVERPLSRRSENIYTFLSCYHDTAHDTAWNFLLVRRESRSLHQFAVEEELQIPVAQETTSS